MSRERVSRLFKAAMERSRFGPFRRRPRFGVDLDLPPERLPARWGGYLSVVALIRNEAPDIAEWVEFQRVVGFEHVYIYDDGSTDGTVAILEPFIAQGFVTVVPWSRFLTSTGHQFLAYAHALTTFGSAWRWMAFLDRDEYLFPVEDDSLAHVLAQYEDLPAIVVPWHVFGFNGHDERPSGLIVDNYTRRLPFPPPPEPSALFKWKSIVHPPAIGGLATAHFFRLTDGRIGGYTEDRHWIESIPGGWPSTSTRVFRLNHYFTQSRDDFRRRRSIALDPAAAFGQYEFNQSRVQKMVRTIELAETVDDHLIRRYSPRLREAFAERGVEIASERNDRRASELAGQGRLLLS